MTWQITITGHEHGEGAPDLEETIADLTDQFVDELREISGEVFQAQFSGLHATRDFIPLEAPDEAS